MVVVRRTVVRRMVVVMHRLRGVKFAWPVIMVRALVAMPVRMFVRVQVLVYVRVGVRMSVVQVAVPVPVIVCVRMFMLMGMLMLMHMRLPGAGRGIVVWHFCLHHRKTRKGTLPTVQPMGKHFIRTQPGV
jgi:hypothetical protein